MNQITRTQRRIRVGFVPLLIAAAIIVAAVGGYLVGSALKAAPATTGQVTSQQAFVRPGSDLNSEYLLRASREWAAVPMTAEQARVTSELNSQYLRDASASWFTPMTHERAAIRAELNSEYLREAALGW